jgi:hypothetical protein
VNILDPSHWGQGGPERLNPLSTLVFEQLNLSFLLLHFVVFFAASFLFYGALFAVLGARSGADGWQGVEACLYAVRCVAALAEQPLDRLLQASVIWPEISHDV